MSDDVKIAGLRPAARPVEDDTQPSVRDPSLADEALADAYVEAGPVRSFFSGIAGIMGSLFRPKATGALVEPPEVIDEAKALRSVMRSPKEGQRVFAAITYGALSEQFAEGSAEVYDGAAALRGLLDDPYHDVRHEAFGAYRKLSNRFEEYSPEVYREAAALRGLIENTGPTVRNKVINAYGELSIKFSDDSPEVYRGAAVMRRMMDDHIPNAEAFHRHFGTAVFDDDSLVTAIAIMRYGDLSAKFSEGSDEVYQGAAALRRMMEAKDRSGVRRAAADSYKLLSLKFTEGSDEVYQGAAVLRGVMSDSNESLSKSAISAYEALSQKFKENWVGLVAEADAALKQYMARPQGLSDLLKRGFHLFTRVGFFKAGFESGTWLDGLELTRKAARTLRGFADQPGFIGRRDSVMAVLDFLSGLGDGRCAVASSVFEATDPAKWKSVRNTLSTLRTLAALDSLPKEVGREFYRSHRDLEGDTRAALRSGVEKTLFAFLRERIGDDRAVDMLFRDEAPKGRESRKQWQHAQEVRRFLSDKGLLVLLAQSASFMDEEGVRILRAMIADLVKSPVLEGELHYLKRYDRMRDQLGFSPSFVGRWRTEWKNVRESTGEAVDVGEAKALVMKQAAGQLAVHVNSTPGVDGEFKELPDSLRALTEKLTRGDADIEETNRLHDIMELNYAKIRETYGDLFANARVDLKNLVRGLTRGVKVAKRAALTEITGLVEKIAFHGTIPTETCQRLSSLYAESTNGKGQPLNKLLWGQFKLANHIIDGEIMARRMIEVTRDEEGREHLLAERAYTAGGFAGLAEFDEDIVEHARGIGIERDRVHFLDRHEKRSSRPHPLATGARMYRDSGLPEINPAFTNPFRPMIPAAASMPVMSAAMMLRTGT